MGLAQFVESLLHYFTPLTPNQESSHIRAEPQINVFLGIICTTDREKRGNDYHNR